MNADVDGAARIDPGTPDVSVARDAGPRAWFAGRRFYLLAAIVCLLIAGAVSLLASPDPDGLERVANDTGFASSAQESATSGSPLADYQLGAEGDGDSGLGTAAAGVVGIALTAAVAFAVFAAVGRRKPATGESAGAAAEAGPSTSAT